MISYVTLVGYTMTKFAIGLIIFGIVTLSWNIGLLIFGVPGETDIAKAVINRLSETTDSPQVNSITRNANSSLDIIDIASWIIPITSIASGGLLLSKENGE